MTGFNKQQPRRKFLYLAILTFAFLMATSVFSAGFAQAATLSWTAPTSYTDGTPITSSLGYKVSIGTTSGSYSQTVDVGSTTSYALSNLTPGTTYYLAVKAYDASGDLSGYSSQVTYTAQSTASYSITASAGTGGSISPSGSVTVASGGSQSFAIAPASGYKVAGVTVDGASVGAVSSYTFSNVAANHTIAASFTAATATNYTITASAGTGGSISPSGSVSVASGASQTFSIAPASGYSIAAVAVDGTSVGAVSSYTFSSVAANHTIAASFSAATTTSGGTSSAVFATNSGGPQYASSSTGVTYAADTKYSGGNVGTTTATISGTSDGALYQTERYGNFSYTIPVSNGTYNVTLKFAEIYFSAAGQRVFNVAINGQTVISNLDIYAKAGKNAAYDVAIPVNVTNGSINVTFTSVVNNAKVSAISVVPTSAGSGNLSFTSNAGGSLYLGTGGVDYLADNGYSGGSAASTTATISGTTDGTLYQTERYGNFSYKIPVNNGNYNLTLKFAEIYWSATGKRVFNVAVNGQTVISNLDIYAKVGKNAAYDVVIPVSVTNGAINVTFTSVVDNAKVSAISVKSM